MTTPIKKAGWQAGLNKHFNSYSTRVALMLAIATSCGAGITAMIVLMVHLIGSAA